MAAPRSTERSVNLDGGDEYFTAVASSSSPASDEASQHVTASMETLAAIEKSREQGWSEVKEGVVGDGGDEYFTAVASSSSPASDEASQHVTASMETLAAIEKSREQGWSEVKEVVVGALSRVLSVEDQLLWEELKREAPGVFIDTVEGLKLGPLIAEGGQAHIYEAWIDGIEEAIVAKVFKLEGFSLVDLHRQWPRRMVAYNGSEGLFESKHLLATTVGGLIIDKSEPIHEIDGLQLCNVLRGCILKDGSFAFLMDKYDGDLRTLINLRLVDNNNQGPPFSYENMLSNIFSIAEGMKRLHGNGILHRDLKAANVLYKYITRPQSICCYVADYESAMMVQGTGFWRAPEVLQDLLKNPRDRNKEIWTKKADVYSFAMTCYEVMTGHIPFYGYVKSDWKRVIDGERPHLPDYVDPMLAELVEMCWDKEPSKRPTFDDIAVGLGIVVANNLDKIDMSIFLPYLVHFGTEILMNIFGG